MQSICTGFKLNPPLAASPAAAGTAKPFPKVSFFLFQARTSRLGEGSALLATGAWGRRCWGGHSQNLGVRAQPLGSEQAAGEGGGAAPSLACVHNLSAMGMGAKMRRAQQHLVPSAPSWAQEKLPGARALLLNASGCATVLHSAAFLFKSQGCSSSGQVGVLGVSSSGPQPGSPSSSLPMGSHREIQARGPKTLPVGRSEGSEGTALLTGTPGAPCFTPATQRHGCPHARGRWTQPRAPRAGQVWPWGSHLSLSKESRVESCHQPPPTRRGAEVAFFCLHLPL